ncbi:RHS repeat-associated core domain-containing protein [Actinoplanes sp. OR16]|uniref:RHS repeat-associated core domain-containing protein n=1 Tax=Actinoplanes sp. OR16 TaxID=946334 RepID=UPI00135F1A3C|nr:RHS repeat-associated core domain-containing protein [Actinoplanes sp. OR16]
MRWFDGRVWVFDGTGRLLQADRLTFRYGEGRLVGVTGRGGRTVALEWSGDRVTAVGDVSFGYVDGVLVCAGDDRYEVDEHGRVVAVVDADGVVEARNSYDADGRVVEQESRFGRRTRYAYLPGRVTVVGDAGSEVTNTYVHDQRGRLLSVMDGHGGRLSRTYDEWGNPVTVTDRKGAVTTMRWDDRGRLLRRAEPAGEVFAYHYDEAGRVLEVAAGDAVVRYRYAGEGRTPVAVVDGEGGVTRFAVQDDLVYEVTDPDGVRLTFGFDDAGDLISATDALGNTARLLRDDEGRLIAAVTPLGRETRFRYDGSGRLVEREDPGGGAWRYEYSPAGRIVSVTDPTGARRETTYGTHGAVDATTDPLGQVTGRRYDDDGNLIRLVAADGAKWDFTYDALSRLTATTDPAGATWLREYDAEGNPIGAVDPAGVHRTVTVDGNGRITGLGDGLTGSGFEYDQLGRTVAHLRPDGTAALAGHDRCGRRTTITDPSGGVTRIEYSPGGRIRRVLSPGGRETVFDYDPAGRRIAAIDGAGRRTDFTYDADGALITAGSTAFRYDEAGRLIARGPSARHDSARGTGSGDVRYSYDLLGRVVAITDPGGGTRRFERDAAGRVVAAVDALGGRTTYQYHARGWLTSITDPLGGTATRRHDERGRVMSETDPLGRTTSFGWDPSGRLRSRTDGAGRTVTWRYDASGRVVTMTAGDGSVVTFRRDLLGRPVAIDDGPYRQRLTWDRAGRLISHERDGLVLRRRYGPDGERTALILPDGSATTYTYDGGGLLSEMAHPLTGRLAITRDALGRIVAIAGDDGRRATWEYDTSGRLTGYSFGSSATRRIPSRYDAAGQLVEAGGRTMRYDAAGRLVRDGEQTFSHDAAGQLVTATGNDASTGFGYDGSGRRLHDRLRTYEWDGFGRLKTVIVDGRRIPVRVDVTGELAEIDGKAVLWDRAPCWLGGEPIVGPGVPWQIGDAPLTPDRQGTPSSANRDVWGAPALTEPGIGFRGELEFAGLTWLRNRVYDPSTRAFLSTDPLPPVPGTAWSGNPYHYAGNDPIGHADPLGLRPITDAELAAYRDGLSSGFFEDAADWAGDNREYLAAGAMVVGGVALMFTGVGGPAGIALMAASGGLIAGGASAGIQKFTTGEVNWGQVGRDALIGAAAGGVGAGTVAALSSSARLAATNPFTRELIINGAENVVTGGLDRGLTGGDIFNPKALTADLLSGGVLRSPGARDAAEGMTHVWRFHTLSEPQSLRPNLTLDPLEDQKRYMDSIYASEENYFYRAESHAGGGTQHSPFVSMTTDPYKAAASPEPQLSTIATGFPGHSLVSQAPDLSLFRVPQEMLTYPQNELSRMEGEVLFDGMGGRELSEYMVNTQPNPFPLPPPPWAAT